MLSKKEFKKLVDSVSFKTRKSQEQLAIEMGYGKNYISEMLTPTGKLTEKFIAAFKNNYRAVLENPNIFSHEEELPLSVVREDGDETPWQVITRLSKSIDRLTMDNHRLTGILINSTVPGATSSPSSDLGIGGNLPEEQL